MAGNALRSRGPDRRILIVDDEVLIADYVAMAAEKLGFRVVGVASSFDEALQLADPIGPEIAVVDVNLGTGRDGVDLALRLQALHGTRIMFISGGESPLARAEQAGIEGATFLKKPFVEAGFGQRLQEISALPSHP